MSKFSFSRTTLIIGAGAHVPYEYPTAKQLTELFKTLHRDCERVTSISDTYLSSDRLNPLDKHKIKICRVLRDLKVIHPEEKPRSANDYDIKLGHALESFLIEFGKSQVYSVDSYLANYLKRSKELQDPLVPIIGKLLISYFILDQERKTPIGFHKFDWIQFIINEYLTDKSKLESFFLEPPKIFTFNYDNHFEKSIYLHLTSYHGISADESLRMIKKLNVKHLYGDINSLEVSDDAEVYRNSLSRLLVIGEERTVDLIKNKSVEIYKAIYSSDDVFMLGFGFDKLNTSMIFGAFPRNEEFNDINFHSTNIGLTKYDQAKVEDLIPVRINFYMNEVVDCLELISRKKLIFTKSKRTQTVTFL